MHPGGLQTGRKSNRLLASKQSVKTREKRACAQVREESRDWFARHQKGCCCALSTVFLYHRSRRATLSTCGECGNMSTGWRESSR
eukprot:2941485-Rhodomonas_salina.3